MYVEERNQALFDVSNISRFYPFQVECRTTDPEAGAGKKARVCIIAGRSLTTDRCPKKLGRCSHRCRKGDHP